MSNDDVAINNDERKTLPENIQRQDKKSVQFEYLIEMYKLFHGNTNTMFNYFLLISGLVLNAFIQSLQKQAAISQEVSASIALFGMVMSVVSFLINIRSTDMLYTLEAGLLSEEKKLFPEGGGVFLVHRKRSWFLRYKYLFPILYCIFITAFVFMFIYAGWGYLTSSSPH